jgi:hypothetical protein
MEVITEYGNYWDLKDHSWSGALDTLADIERANVEEELMQHLEEVFMDRTPTDTEVNDYLWHDRESVYEAVGLNENGEIPTVVDEARENCSNWHVSVAEIKKAGIFEQSLINYIIDMIQADEDEQGNPVYDEDEIYWLDFDELESNSDTVTEEQIEWLNANG